MSKIAIQASFGESAVKAKLGVFLLLTLLLAPVLAITTVGTYGLGVWVYQMMARPPGPPAKPARAPGIVPKCSCEELFSSSRRAFIRGQWNPDYPERQSSRPRPALRGGCNSEYEKWQ